jgi:formylglycine-generating enzyme
MPSHKKYQIAISVAEEDLSVANSIATSLKEIGVTHYLYTQHRAKNWGQHILKISIDTYGAEANYVLMIISKTFVEKYWANIERQIADIFKPGKKIYILPLRLDDTPVDGLSKYIVFEKWNNNPDEIAHLLQKKLNEKKIRFPHKLISYIKKNRALYKLMSYIATAFVSIIIILLTFTGSKNNIITTPTNLGDTTKVVAITPATTIGKKSTTTSTPNSKQIALKTIAPQRENATLITPIADTKNNTDTSKPYKINLSPFYISKTEITVAQYKNYCTTNGVTMPTQYEHRMLDSCPVVNVTWQEAMAYCTWVGGRLPTEAEWEYAADGNNSNKYSGGNNLTTVAVYETNSSGDKPSKVGTKNPNSFGLYDMTGNVAEWCTDWYDVNNTIPANQYNPKETSKGTKKVVKGGAFNSLRKTASGLNELLITNCGSEYPNKRKSFIGFRVVWNK